MPMNCPVINLLFRGDTKPFPLEDEYVREFELRGLSALTIPPLKFQFTNISHLLHLLQQQQSPRKGLIITSPRVAQAIQKALELVDEITRRKIIDSFTPELVFVVGERTALECSKIGFQCNQESANSGNSKNLVPFIKATCATRQISLIYPKGSLASNFLEEELLSGEHMSVMIDSVVVYETKKADNLLEEIPEELSKFTRNPITTSNHEAKVRRVILNAIFFSPSGVDAFASIDRADLLIKLRALFYGGEIKIFLSAIGETTKEAIESNKFHCFCVSRKPNATCLVDSVIEQLNKLD